MASKHGNTGLLSNSLSIKVFKIFYAFDIAIKHFLLTEFSDVVTDI